MGRLLFCARVGAGWYRRSLALNGVEHPALCSGSIKEAWILARLDLFRQSAIDSGRFIVPADRETDDVEMVDRHRRMAFASSGELSEFDCLQADPGEFQRRIGPLRYQRSVASERGAGRLTADRQFAPRIESVEVKSAMLFILLEHASLYFQDDQNLIRLSGGDDVIVEIYTVKQSWFPAFPGDIGQGQSNGGCLSECRHILPPI